MAVTVAAALAMVYPEGKKRRKPHGSVNCPFPVKIHPKLAIAWEVLTGRLSMGMTGAAVSLSVGIM